MHLKLRMYLHGDTLDRRSCTIRDLSRVVWKVEEGREFGMRELEVTGETLAAVFTGIDELVLRDRIPEFCSRLHR
jgi:hypothetical protein